MSKLLISEPPLIVLPSLAKAIGPNEAIFLQQLHFLLLKSNHTYKGKKWVYNSYEQWLEVFPFFGRNTLKRLIKDLKSQGLIVCGNFNKMKLDKTQWYTIDYKKVSTIGPKWPYHGAKMGQPQGHFGSSNTKDFLQRLSTEEKEPASKNPEAVSPPTPPGATPQTPTPSPQETASPPSLQGEGEKSTGEVDKCRPCTSDMEGQTSACRQSLPGMEESSAKGVVDVWSARLKMIPRMRGPGGAKRRQWIGELERWVKEDGGLTYQEILDVLIFAMESDFWRTVILSPKALKKHWDTLVGQRISRNGNQEVATVLTEFAQAYKKVRGKEYIREGKDVFKARELLAQVGTEEVRGIVKEFFDREDDFLDKQGRTFSCFVGQVNRLRRREKAETVNAGLQKSLEIIRAERARNGKGQG